MAESRTGTRRGLESSPPLVTAEGIKPLPPTGARKVDLRTLFFYGYTGITPAMCMRLTNIGCQYLVAFKDAGNTFLDGARSYQVTLPPDIPEARFWSLTPYDNETRSMLQTPSASPGPAASATHPGRRGQRRRVDHIHLGPEKPEGVAEGNWIQTVPGKGWFIILRLYSPLASFFDILS